MSGWRLSPIMVVLWTQQQWLLRIHLSILTTQHQSKIVSGIVFRKGSNTSFMILLLSQFLLPHSITLIMLSEQRIVTLSIIDMGQLVRPIHIPQIIIIMQLVQLMLMHTPTAIAPHILLLRNGFMDWILGRWICILNQPMIHSKLPRSMCLISFRS